MIITCKPSKSKNPRPPRAKRMTICIGILAHDGIVIAADAEESDSYFKRSAQKLMTWHTMRNADGQPAKSAACVIAGAGDGGFIDAFTAEFTSGLKSDWALGDFETYAQKTLESFYGAHVRPLLKADPNADFSVLVGVYFGWVTRLYKSYKTTLSRVQAATAAIGIGQEYAFRLMDEYPITDAARTELIAAAVVSGTKDCIAGCGKYTDIVTIHNALIVPDDAHGSRLEHPPSLISRPHSDKIARWENVFKTVWTQRQRKLSEELIEEEIRQSDSQKSKGQP